MAGSSLRRARSPVAPKITSVVGWTGSRSRPSIKGLWSGTWPSLTSAVAISSFVSVSAVGPALHGVAAELGPQRRVHLGREVAAALRVVPLIERRGDHRQRDALVDRVLDGPPALAGLGDDGLERREVVAVLLEGVGRQLAEPRADDRAAHPEVRDLRVVELELRGVEEPEALRVGLHHPVLDAVVHHLDVVAGAGRAHVAPARAVLLVGRRREHVEERRQALDRGVGPADHHAVADLQAPDAAGGPDVDVVDAELLELLGPLNVVGPLGVAAVDDRVALLEQFGELVDRLLRRVAGG